MITIDPKYRTQAEERFSDLQNSRELMQERRDGAVSAGRIYAYVQGKADTVLEEVLKTNLSVRRVYRAMLNKHAYIHMEQALAASTEDYPERHSDGCRLRLQASRAESQQLYLIIEMSDLRRDMPQSLALFGINEDMARLQLPAARNGVIQTIIDKTSDVAKLLGDPKTEIFLR